MDPQTAHPSILRIGSPLRRELLVFAVALFCGVLILPLLIYAAGLLVLGPYANGGAVALLWDYLKGLAAGSPAYWTIALGPYVFVQLLRGGLRLVLRGRETSKV